MLTFGGYDMEVWSSKVIITIWNIFCLIWNAWNAHLHTEMAMTCSFLHVGSTGVQDNVDQVSQHSG
eukprot:805814-Ditylum_brightwellii.AAC.1